MRADHGEKSSKTTISDGRIERLQVKQALPNFYSKCDIEAFLEWIKSGKFLQKR